MVIVIDIKIIRVVLDRFFEILNYFLKTTFIHMDDILDQTVLDGPTVWYLPLSNELEIKFERRKMNGIRMRFEFELTWRCLKGLELPALPFIP